MAENSPCPVIPIFQNASVPTMPFTTSAEFSSELYDKTKVRASILFAEKISAKTAEKEKQTQNKIDIYILKHLISGTNRIYKPFHITIL